MWRCACKDKLWGWNKIELSGVSSSDSQQDLIIGGKNGRKKHTQFWTDRYLSGGIGPGQRDSGSGGGSLNSEKI
jgi:hypothetical protein